jgi:D-lactate dehydrogenase
MRVLNFSTHEFDRKYLERHSSGIHSFDFCEDSLRINTAEWASGYDAITLFTSDDASAPVLEKLTTLGVKYICLRSAGYDHINLSRARELGMRVANVSAYSPYAVAEHALTLLMALNRKILAAAEQFKKNDFRLNNLIGFDVYGKTVGVVGTGKIGSAFVRIMLGMGCKVLAYDIHENSNLTDWENFEYTNLENLCRHSDIIALFCPLNEQTRYMFNRELFSKMKKGVIFINTARGGIVHTQDLMEAIENGQIGAAGLDVYENEKSIYFKDLRYSKIPDPVFERLRNLPQVLLTAHQAFLTHEALEGIAQTTVKNLSDWEKFGKSENDLT